MRRSLLLYLFVFAALIAVFQYVTSRKMLESKNSEIEALKEEIDILKTQAGSVPESGTSSELFLFEANDQAMSYFEDRGFKPSEVVLKIEDEIIGRNKTSEDNALVPYEGMQGNMRVNRIRILNHKWILADFTDGSNWGELFLIYDLNDKGELELRTESSLLYPQN